MYLEKNFLRHCDAIFTQTSQNSISCFHFRVKRISNNKSITFYIPLNYIFFKYYFILRQLKEKQINIKIKILYFFITNTQIKLVFSYFSINIEYLFNNNLFQLSYNYNTLQCKDSKVIKHELNLYCIVYEFVKQRKIGNTAC